MTAAQYAALISAALGACGTIVLFFATYGFQPLEGGVFGSPELQEWNARIKAKNKERKIRQRIGLGLLCCSFAVQAVSVFLSYLSSPAP